jgi:hypothetical protein
MRTKRTWRLLLTALALAVLAAGCGGGGGDDGSKDSGSSGGERPTTPTRIQITAPAPNQVVGAETPLTVNLIGGKVVDRTTGLTPDEGHIHVLLDGKLVNMAYETTQQLTGLTPGNHTVTVEFVAVDHAPFKNAPKAAVIFSSQ